MLHRFFCIICTFLLLITSAGAVCVAQQHADIHAFIDNWHKAAAEAKADVFFGSMASDCIYIGTDKTERWTKAQFISFAKPYFDKGKAWDFKPYDRDLHVTLEGKSAWFSELLTTWMGVCRGSGVLAKENGKWVFKQYHLSVTVPNDLVRDFITLVENFERKAKP
ncbi:nuclear transport factor 2 family protein [Chryseolinea sp. T2]|uniref:nuclear transport factor 2 family protein n=1 Tax=Chryseolinea sp. T2 TaxID=3129255 RepID=UPI0030787563